MTGSGWSFTESDDMKTEQVAQHTPGPWSTSQTGRYVRIVRPGTILNICDTLSCFGPDEEMANARLIAAAPELLEAVKIALDGNTKLDKFAEKALRDALAKATNPQPHSRSGQS